MTSNSRDGYISELDGVRAFAVLAVMIFHAFPTLMWGGFLAVEVFFVLSGFLITWLLMRECDRFGQIDLPHFYMRRLLRLIPALVVMLVGAIAICAVLTDVPTTFWVIKDAALVMTYGSNWIRALELRPDGVFCHCWSLAVEEQFYLLWPPLLIWMKKKAPTPRTLVIWVCGLSLMSTATRSILCLMGSSVARLCNGLDVRADGILLGAAFAIALQTGLVSAGSIAWQRNTRKSVPVAVILLMWLAFTTDARSQLAYTWALSLTGWCALVMLAAVMILERHPLKVLLRNRVLQWLGQRSYGLYLWHVPLLHLFITSGFDPVAAFLVAYTLSLIFAELSFRYVEQPVLRLRLRFQPRIPVGGIAINT